MTAATPTLKIDDDRVRVTEWRFAPGAATGWHVHEYPYVVVPLTTGELEMIDESGTASRARLTMHEPYNKPAGVAHDVVNPNDFDFAFLEIEMKG